jgi:tetratricopeptide (TPR) repeat protein
MAVDSIKQLRIILLAGLFLIILSGIVLLAAILFQGSGSRQQDSFNRILREYDTAFNEIFFTEREFDYLNSELDRLEKRAISVESWLSILKRRRTLANIHPSSMANYRKSLENALKAYPSSEPVIAIASAALIKNSAINKENEEQLRLWLSLFNDTRFNDLRLALHVLLGDFKNPQSAFSVNPGIISDNTESISVNLAILKTLRGNYHGAAADIHALLSNPTAVSLRFAAEYYFDFGDLLRSAEIFSYLSEFSQSPENAEKAIIRQADALYLAGFTETASSIWSILPFNETSLYNLAITSMDGDQQQAALFLERLVNMDEISGTPSLARQFGLIRYSRLFDYYAALEILMRSSPDKHPYIDLEICKRHAREQNLGRQIAETWLLLDRHEGNRELYRWAAWHFFLQRRFDESKILLDRLNLHQITDYWIEIYRAVQLMNEGYLDDAQNILRSIPANQSAWYVYANLGRILETSGSPARALEQYEMAMQLLLSDSLNNKTAARVQLRIARCLTALNRHLEAHRALQYALDLDPLNLAARLEMDRFF